MFRHSRLFLALLVAAALLVQAVAPAGAEKFEQGGRVTWKQVEDFITLTQSRLLNSVARDGSVRFDGGFGNSLYDLGASALVCYALLASDIRPGDKTVDRLLLNISNSSLQKNALSTYTAACVAMALAEADPVRYRLHIQTCADYLAKAQLASGMWSYNASGRDGRAINETGDNSNTQFAVLGLKAAHEAGCKVDQRVFQRTRGHFLRTQHRSGGWGYSGWAREDPYGSMTAAGVASLWAIGEILYGKEHHCGDIPDPDLEKSLYNGVKWLDKNFAPTGSGLFGASWDNYYLYAVERVGIFTSQRYMNDYDWYRAGAAQIVNSGLSSSVSEVAFALLFLAKGRHPLIIQKLERPGADWDNDHYDLENLTKFYSEAARAEVTWSNARMRLDAADLLEAPLLLISGREKKLDLSGLERRILREYLQNGGMLLVVPASDSVVFADSFRVLMKEMYPESALELLPKDHPVYSHVFEIDPANRPDIYSLHEGCSLKVLFIPQGQLTCKWTTNDDSSQAFKLGTNILGFLTGDEALKNRIDPIRFTPLQDLEDLKRIPPPRGAVVIGQIRHSGMWKPNQFDIPNLMRRLNEKAGVTVGLFPEFMDLGTSPIYNYPILYMTGLRNFSRTPEESARLRIFLEKGGFLFADPACGQYEFRQAFRAFMTEVFPDRKLEPIPLDDDIMTVGYDIRRVKYRAAVLKQNPGLNTPVLEGIRVGERWGVVFSPYNFNIGLNGQPCPTCVGLAEEDSFRVAVNIVLYALSN